MCVGVRGGQGLCHSLGGVTGAQVISIVTVFRGLTAEHSPRSVIPFYSHYLLFPHLADEETEIQRGTVKFKATEQVSGLKESKAQRGADGSGGNQADPTWKEHGPPWTGRAS